MDRFPTRALGALALAWLVAACAPAFGGRGAVTEIVTLPGGEVCGFAGEGATLAFDGLRLSWTCDVAPSGPRGLFGAPVVVGDTAVSWRLGTTGRRAAGGGFELVAMASVDALVARFQTAAGDTCAFAGMGATLAVDGRRVNYTCAGDVVAVGPLVADAAGLSATVGTLVRTADRTELRRPRLVRLTSVELVEDAVSAGLPPALPSTPSVTTPSVTTPTATPAPAGHAPLLGTTWALQRIRYADGSELVPDEPERYTLTLATDGSAALRVDCNRGVGRFEMDGDRLAFSTFATTRAFCGADSLDTPVLMQVAIVVGYRFDETGTLLLATSMDASQLEFRPLE